MAITYRPAKLIKAVTFVMSGSRLTFPVGIKIMVRYDAYNGRYNAT